MEASDDAARSVRILRAALCLVNQVDWQALGTFVALGGVIASLWIAIRGQGQERTLADSSARRAEAAARLTEAYTQRVVEALEVMAERGFGPSWPARPPVVKWSLVQGSGDSFVLENSGDATAYDVTVGGHETLVGPDVVAGDPAIVAPGEAITFLAALSLATSDTTITVRWRGDPQDHDGQQWRYPLPV